MSLPNVIFILTDDQGYGDLSYTGNPVLRTPAGPAADGERALHRLSRLSGLQRAAS